MSLLCIAGLVYRPQSLHTGSMGNHAGFMCWTTCDGTAVLMTGTNEAGTKSTMTLTQLSTIQQLLPSVKKCHLATTMTLSSFQTMLDFDAISGRSILLGDVRSITILLDPPANQSQTGLIPEVQQRG